MKKTRFNRPIALLCACALLICLLPALAPAARSAGESGVIPITTAGDFAELAANCTLDTWSQGKKVVLQADISLADGAVSSIPTFGGVFDGNGHTISGLDISRSETPAGLFGVLQETGVIRNLKVDGSVTPSGDSGNVGGIVGENYGRITGCSFTGSVLGGTNVGGIAGINAVTGEILGCKVSGSLVGDKMTGGIAGCNLGVIESCRNYAYVNTVSVDPTIRPEDLNLDFSMDLSRLTAMDTSMIASDTGGIAGYSCGILSGCANSAPIGYPHIGYNVGGIVGRNCGYLHACENTGDIFGRKDVGGIAGQMEPYIAQNLTESTLSKLERQLDELDLLLDAALNDANAGVGALTSRLNRIADYADSASGAASSIRTSGSITGTVDGSGEADGSGSVTVTPPQVEVAGSGGAAGGGATILTPIGGITGGVVTEGEIQGGLTEGGVAGESHTSAGGSLSASTQISVTTNLNGLTSAISGMSGQMRLLSGELSGTSGTLSEDLKAIQKQIRTISDTAMELFQGDGSGDLLVDSSDVDIDLVTLGKASGCRNSGSVSGDINVGGITGAMAMEYELDPEDDITANLDGSQRRKLEVKAIVRECVNTGKITAKRSYAGGICGRMDLGLIDQSESYGGVSSESGDYVGGIAGLAASTVRHCFAKCTLSGEKNVGGIVGSGVTEDLTGGSSTVAGCYSMVSIEACQEFAGAISGVNAGTFVENYFLSDTLTGINGRSYTGKAEPISYDKLLEIAETGISPELPTEATDAAGETGAAEATQPSEGDEGAQNPEETEPATLPEPVPIPDAFLRLTLTFVAEDQVIASIPFAYGDSFDESVYPEIPRKDGYDARWDTTSLENLHFDTVVTAIYTPYVTALANTETRADGRPIFFVEGQFDEDAATVVTPLPNTPEDFDVLATDWVDFLTKSFSGSSVSREIVEQWRISIPEDGQRFHTVRYLAPDRDPEHLDIYVKGQNGWQKAEQEILGSYLAFPVEGTEAQIAVLSTVSVWWVWLLAGIALVLVLILILRLLHKLRNAVQHRARKPASGEIGTDSPSPDAGDSPTPAAPRKKRRWLVPLAIVLALLVGILGTAAFFLLPDLLDARNAYDLLKKYDAEQELRMDLAVDAEVGGLELDFTALVDRTELDGHRVTVITQEDRTLCYCDGTVFLENGKACKLNSAFPDYTRLLEQSLELYRRVDIDAEGDTYTITAEGADAKTILALLLPASADVLSEANTMQVELVCDDGEATQIRFTGSGNLNDGEKTPFRVAAVLSLGDESLRRVSVPEPVRSAIASGDWEAAEILSEDLLRMVGAWQALNRQATLGAVLRLRADCGPVALDSSLDFFRWDWEGTRISAIRKNGYALYFTDSAVCNESGRSLAAGEAETVEAAKLLDIGCEACLNGTPECTEDGGKYTYTLWLDEAGMESVAYAIAPAAEGMDIRFDRGSIRFVIEDGALRNMEIRCEGDVQVVLSHADVVFEAEMEFTEGTDPSEIPAAVKETLAKPK